MLRSLLHKVIVTAAMLPLLLAFAAIGVFVLLAVAADMVLPDARWGNCWTYACARWARLGGYIGLRPADDIKILNAIPVPHVIWQETLRGQVRMTYPMQRKAARFFPLHALLHRFTIWHGDGPHAADWEPSSTPPEWARTTQPPRG